jgi:CRISPR-associated protein Cas5h
MESIPVIAIGYQAKYGHFRKPYSNVSSLTYPFPPRPAIAGLLGAILGIKKDDVSEFSQDKNMKVGVEIEKEIKTITHVTNFRQDSSGNVDYSIKISKKAKTPKPLKNALESNMPTQIPMELLRDPRYILYVNLADRMDELKSRLKYERSVYTPCMGLSEFLAKLEYISEDVATFLEPGEREISTVIAKDDCSLVFKKITSNKGYNIQELKVPHIGDKERRFSYKNYILNLAVSPIPVNMRGNSYQFEKKNITFL